MCSLNYANATVAINFKNNKVPKTINSKLHKIIIYLSCEAYFTNFYCIWVLQESQRRMRSGRRATAMVGCLPLWEDIVREESCPVTDSHSGNEALKSPNTRK